MLGVLKRRWKPSKRASSGYGTDSPLNADLTLDKARPVHSPRQVHPLYGEKAGLKGYYDSVGNTENFPPAPNIVVEGGRIEFVRPSHDGTMSSRKNMISRSSQTFIEQPEKTDPDKSTPRIVQPSKTHRLMGANLTKLNRKEVTQRDVERERQLRLEAEARVREATTEAERSRTKVHHLQCELARMEESSRNMLHHKQLADQLKQERTTLTLSYETKLHQCQNQISKLQLENESMRGQLRGLEALARDADSQRKQYERCLDDVANQVVRALLSQKGLREEIGALQRRIRELETQNRTLTGLLSQTNNNSNKNSPNELLHNLLEVGSTALVATLGIDNNWLQLQRPHSLNLKIPLIQTTKQQRTRIRYPITQKLSEEEGSESPESGNRDEGYSTMSSDVQADQSGHRHDQNNEQQQQNYLQQNYSQQQQQRGLEDLKEANDETEADLSTDSRLITLDIGDPDVLFLPLNLTVGFNPRHSYPPSKELLPFQHIIKSFSDSHLCLKLTSSSTATATTVTTTTTTSASSSSSSPLPQFCIKKLNNNNNKYNNNSNNSDSSSLILVDDDNWDAEYVQQWLRLDDTRTAQQNRDLLELDYDKAELEDWSFSLSSNDDLKNDINYDKQKLIINNNNIPLLQLPSIREHNNNNNNNNVELEEDSNECLWNGSSYLADRTGSELMALLMDTRTSGPWPYASSPGVSWSSDDDTKLLDYSSKRSSAALSGCSDDNESPSIGTDFTRDFYRLVKFESTKSLASNSSKSGNKLPQEREQALQSVLNFIAEQQMYLATDSSKINDDDNDDVCIDDNAIVEIVHDDEINDSLATKTTAASTATTASTTAAAEINNLNNFHECDLIEDERTELYCGLSGVLNGPCLGELVAVPEEDEEAATSSTPSTVVSPERAPMLVEENDRGLSFHEKATSKDVINELNRMIRKGEDGQAIQERVEIDKLDLACCCPTGWVHVERDIDFTDPKARANLLDVMLASSESSSATSSSGSAGSDSGDEPPDYRHLHRLHRYRRQKKASAVQAHRVLRLPSIWGPTRPSIIGRGEDFFVRYGDKEREAVASFDFLDDIPVSLQSTSPPSSTSSGELDKLLPKIDFMKVSPL
ncbi:hypothetical protein HCN44_003730 [Aphidius gifuensis]|uniref:Uncharacterized protein n=1 Tax=Aphidius gifuensis TaxID=684658 RepID=A0A834XJ68_APHGI|nr:hypothetical protein HCN44_003730 [Aphidius gifuensis]